MRRSVWTGLAASEKTGRPEPAKRQTGGPRPVERGDPEAMVRSYYLEQDIEHGPEQPRRRPGAMSPRTRENTMDPDNGALPTQSRTRLNRGLLAALGLILILALSHQLDVAGRVAYALERGRIEADLDHLQALDIAEVATLEQVSHAYAVIAKAVKPSVVYIESVSSNKAVNRELERLFGEHKFQPLPSRGTGSGVILDTEGHIVTNNHVVEDAKVVRVLLFDGRRFRAEVVGTDTMTDLAVIKINAEKLHPARLGDSDRMNVGNIVLAIGSPFRLGHSVSHGIISATGRSNVSVDIDYQNWLQSDAPINPGNSGGPLINTRGEVVGINTAIATESGGHQGVGFAIPSNTVARIANRLKTGEKIVRGYLGVVIQQVDPIIAEAYGLTEPGGVLIGGIGRNTPAAKGGLKPEDIVLAIDGNDIATREQLQELIANTTPGTDVDLSVWRKGKLSHVIISVTAQPEDFSTTGSIRDLNRRRGEPQDDGLPEEQTGNTSKAPDAETVALFTALGFEAATVSPKLAKRYGLDEGVQNGAIITYVDPTGEAFDARLRAGQVVTRANGRRIRNLRQLEQVLTRKTLAQGIRLKIRTGRDEFFTVLRLR